MSELMFNRGHAERAIDIVREKGRSWLYETYPKPSGQMRKSSTGFLMYEGIAYPVKPLGRLANELAGYPMTDNPITDMFRRYFEGLNFQLIDSVDMESETAANRQRRMAAVWERPGQAKFRRGVFEKYGARCLITECETLAALEAAHIVPVSFGGGDEAWNGIPLRADLHRLFDAGSITIDAETWVVGAADGASKDYVDVDGKSLAETFSKFGGDSDVVTAFKKRTQLDIGAS